jgi:hypothetical protein
LFEIASVYLLQSGVEVFLMETEQDELMMWPEVMNRDLRMISFGMEMLVADDDLIAKILIWEYSFFYD